MPGSRLYLGLGVRLWPGFRLRLPRGPRTLDVHQGLGYTEGPGIPGYTPVPATSKVPGVPEARVSTIAGSTRGRAGRAFSQLAMGHGGAADHKRAPWRLQGSSGAKEARKTCKTLARNPQISGRRNLRTAPNPSTNTPYGAHKPPCYDSEVFVLVSMCFDHAPKCVFIL